MSTPTRPDYVDLDDAMRRALGYTAAAGLSDGTDRPATTVAELGDVRDADGWLSAAALEELYYAGTGGLLP